MSFNISHVFISIIYKYVQYVYRNNTIPIRTELYLILIITFIITNGIIKIYMLSIYHS